MTSSKMLDAMHSLNTCSIISIHPMYFLVFHTPLSLTINFFHITYLNKPTLIQLIAQFLLCFAVECFKTGSHGAANDGNATL